MTDTGQRHISLLMFALTFKRALALGNSPWEFYAWLAVAGRLLEWIEVYIPFACINST